MSWFADLASWVLPHDHVSAPCPRALPCVCLPVPQGTVLLSLPAGPPRALESRLWLHLPGFLTTPRFLPVAVVASLPGTVEMSAMTDVESSQVTSKGGNTDPCSHWALSYPHATQPWQSLALGRHSIMT